MCVYFLGLPIKVKRLRAAGEIKKKFGGSIRDDRKQKSARALLIPPYCDTPYQSEREISLGRDKREGIKKRRVTAVGIPRAATYRLPIDRGNIFTIFFFGGPVPPLGR